MAPTDDYDIDQAILSWMQDKRIQKRLTSVCDTSGGWEGWAHIELSLALKEAFNLPADTYISEQSTVFNEANYFLPQTADMNGMIIALRCEDNDEQKGQDVREMVQKDIDRARAVRRDYRDWTFVVLAMVYTEEARKAVIEIGLELIPGAEHRVDDQRTLGVYKMSCAIWDLIDNASFHGVR